MDYFMEKVYIFGLIKKLMMDIGLMVKLMEKENLLILMVLMKGKFIKRKKCGFGNDKYYEENWKNVKQNGYCIFYDKNKVTKSIWVDGRIRNRNGETIKKNKTYMEQ
jgi:hypothetical protein